MKVVAVKEKFSLSRSFTRFNIYTDNYIPKTVMCVSVINNV